MEPHQETGHPLPPRQSRSLDEDNRYVKGRYYMFVEVFTQTYICLFPIIPWVCFLYDIPSSGRLIFSAILVILYIVFKMELYQETEGRELTRKLESCTKERDDYKDQFDALVVDSEEFPQRIQMEPHQETGHPLPPRQSRNLDEDNRYVKMEPRETGHPLSPRRSRSLDVKREPMETGHPLSPRRSRSLDVKVLPTSFHCQVCHVNDLHMPVSGAMRRTDAEIQEEKDLINEVEELNRKLESCTEERDDYKGQFDELVVNSEVFQKQIQVFMMDIKDLNIIEDSNIIIGDGNRMRVNTDILPEVLTKLRELKKDLCTANLSLEELREGVKTLTMSMDKGHTKAETIEAGVCELKQLVSDRPEIKVYRECLHSLRGLKDNPRFQGQFKFDDLPDQHAKSGVKRMAATLDESIWKQAAVRFNVNKDTIPTTETDLTKRTRTIYAHLLYQWVCRESDKTEKDLTDIIEDLQDERNRETRKRLEAALKPAIVIKPATPRDTKRLQAVDNKLGLMVPMMEQILDQMNRCGEGISLPEHWDPMKDSEYIKIVMLKPTDPEYQQLEKDFIGQVKNGCYTARLQFDVRTIKIDRIERVQNKHLWQQYVVRKAKIEKEKPTLPADMKPLERKVWHGTAATASTSIETYGFNRSYCGVHGTWFGEGVYFASDASHSARGWLSGAQNTGPTRGCVFSVRAVTGHYTKGKNRMRFLPPIDPAKPLILFDSAVDNVQNPGEFVIFHDTQAYPEYLITFSAN